MRCRGTAGLTSDGLRLRRERLERFKGWIEERPEKVIAVVAHWGTINALTGHDLDNCEVVEGWLSELKRHKMQLVD